MNSPKVNDRVLYDNKIYIIIGTIEFGGKRYHLISEDSKDEFWCNIEWIINHTTTPDQYQPNLFDCQDNV